MAKRSKVGLLFVVVLLTLGSAQAQSGFRWTAKDESSLKKLLAPREHVGRGFNLYSRDDERQMGEDASADVEAHTKLLADEDLTAYLDALGRKLAEQSEVRGTAFHFRVIVDDEINAMALPNGSVYVNSGLLMAAESEAELAGVLAHEIAHVAARHATRAATRRGLWGAAALGVAMFGGGVGAAVQPAVGMTGGGFQMKFSRDAEREADVLGLKYLYAAEYDATAFVRFLERMRREGETKKSLLKKMNESHPGVEERIWRAKRTIELAMPAREASVDDTSEFVEAKARVMRATHPEMITPERPVLKIAARE